MKKWLFLLLTGLFFISTISSCKNSEDVETGVNLKEPPVLQLQYIQKGKSAETVISSGNYEWYYDNPDGTQTGGIACGPHPLDRSEATPELVLDPGQKTLRVVFSLVPETYSLRCWPDSYLGEAEKYESDASALAVTGDTISLPENGKGYIYELTAEWKNGHASYSFHISP